MQLLTLEIEVDYSAKGIIGGAKFVRQGFISKGQNTLYRMRWNPDIQVIINMQRCTLGTSSATT